MRIVAPVLGGLVVFVATFPFTGVDTQPPECWSVFGWEVSCQSGFAPVAAVVAVLLVTVGIVVGGRRGGVGDP